MGRKMHQCRHKMFDALFVAVRLDRCEFMFCIPTGNSRQTFRPQRMLPWESEPREHTSIQNLELFDV